MPSVEDHPAAVEQDVQELQHTVIAGLHAQAFGLSLVQAEVAEVKAVQAEMREEMATREDLAEVKRILTGMGAILDQLIDR